MKKFISCFCMILLLCSCLVCFNGCGKNNDDNVNQTTVMNVSLNPEVEFILDKNNKVLSVNALNEEGNIIIESQTFTNLDANEAVKLFVNVSKETGFVVTGNVQSGENEINISFSGDTKQIDKIYNNISSNLSSFLKDTKVSVKKADNITTDYLKEQVKKCMPQLTEETINNLSYEELLNNLTTSRNETKNLYSESLKEAYYSAKEAAFEKAKLEFLKTKTTNLQKFVIETAEETYDLAISTLNTTRENLLLSDKSLYQLALKEVNKAKVDYVNYRNYLAGLDTEITDTMQSILDNYKLALDTAESNLKLTYENVNSELDKAEQKLKTTYNNVITNITNSGINVDNYLNEMSASATSSLETFTQSFETEFKSFIDSSKSSVESLKAELKEGYKLS